VLRINILGDNGLVLKPKLVQHYFSVVTAIFSRAFPCCCIGKLQDPETDIVHLTEILELFFNSKTALILRESY
jgi:hypothetical protein